MNKSQVGSASSNARIISVLGSSSSSTTDISMRNAATTNSKQTLLLLYAILTAPLKYQCKQLYKYLQKKQAVSASTTVSVTKIKPILKFGRSMYKPLIDAMSIELMNEICERLDADQDDEVEALICLYLQKKNALLVLIIQEAITNIPGLDAGSRKITALEMTISLLASLQDQLINCPKNSLDGRFHQLSISEKKPLLTNYLHLLFDRSLLSVLYSFGRQDVINHAKSVESLEHGYVELLTSSADVVIDSLYDVMLANPHNETAFFTMLAQLNCQENLETLAGNFLKQLIPSLDGMEIRNKVISFIGEFQCHVVLRECSEEEEHLDCLTFNR